MKNITSTIEFNNASATLCGRMVSLDRDTRIQALNDASAMLAALPKFLYNSPHCQDEITAIQTLIAIHRA